MRYTISEMAALPVIVRQMLQKVRVETNGDSEMLPGVFAAAVSAMPFL